MRRAAGLLAGVAVAAGLVVVVLIVVSGRDTSTFTGSTSAPGTLEPDQGAAHHAPPPGFRYATDPPTSGPHVATPIIRPQVTLSRDQLLEALELGDVVLAYGDPADRASLQGVADQVAGGFDRTLVANGQAVLLDRLPGTTGVVALSWRRMLRVSSPSDQRLTAFANAWLGHGAGKNG